ncbi:probable LRR receptor-like serine/threonine-protein kinase At1g56130 isoform X4 [Magnolia sinica]|uniref:probable LRR receptor-like serine/threonine-protein kinase At1g56130 isoform X4 n=1 Tax=Magnolia sinica TaxID=86752 RepID=UPI002658255B|nr:probable LRR receptor-like serine/threonine-protein kinase At1g56130 isoform X4 [Magnolia sinica]
MKKFMSVFALGLYCIYLFCQVERSQAQARTDPSEVRALNAIFQKFGISSDPAWNITGDPCTGSAIDSTKVDSTNINPAIKCDCTFDSGTTCHLKELKMYELNINGQIPEELLNLTYVYNLNMARNYLTGPLPAFIGNLTTLRYLTFGINKLSGTIPKELGNLRSLMSLGLGSNDFTGSLPTELGNLVRLEQLYIDSSGLSGEIPSTFSNLRNLRIWRASDNQFMGKIPDFIGKLTNLTSLRLQGNSFEGPIPSSLSNLTSLQDLRISEVSNGGSSLDFIKDLKDLSILILRNNNISSIIPSNIGEYLALRQLDLSFNNFSGQIPASLFNLNSLAYLFLGNNRLSGTLPAQKSSGLLNIDLSYNELSGSFPSWAREEGLQLNLVANNFVLDNSNSSILPRGLNCLQRNFPCNRGSPRYYSFAINCGGPEITTSSGTKFESDNEPLTATSYYVVDTNRWAVSNVGRFTEGSNIEYTRNTLTPFTNTLDIELFQSARLSPASLRYYGLGLENGNYTVHLQFAERDFPDARIWHSIGRRYFDIYVQGNLVLKDFNIKRDAGGVSFRAVQKDFKVRVSENYLEVHLFWAGKGTCCIPPTGGYYGPSISGVSVTPDFIPTVSNLPPTISSAKNRTGLVVGISVSVGAMIILTIFAAYILIRRRKRLANDEDEDFQGMGTKPNTFSYAQLRVATEDFNPMNKLGEGGFGPVYKGTLPDGKVVAVKQLSAASRQGRSQFMAEIATISSVQHRNLVKLYGCCVEGDKRLLVYEYLDNKSLDQALFGGSNLHLNWSIRYSICLGTARGLAYLHEELRPRIIHRDVKASNILIDADLNPKISDFGLAKLYDENETHISTHVAGTTGYLAPEYAMLGHLTEKADVFGFGVVALEILSGKRNSYYSLDQEKIYLLEQAWYLYENNRALELIDPALSKFTEEEVVRVVGVALLCTQASPMLRPPMSRVVAMLSGDIKVGIATSKPSYLSDWQFNDVSSLTSGDDSRASMGRNTNSQCHTSSSASTVLPADPTPPTTLPLMHEIINKGH